MTNIQGIDLVVVAASGGWAKERYPEKARSPLWYRAEKLDMPAENKVLE